MSEDSFNFDEVNKDFDAMQIALEEAAKAIVPMFLAYRKQGLSVQESAALTAALVAQTMPIIPQLPQED